MSKVNKNKRRVRRVLRRRGLFVVFAFIFIITGCFTIKSNAKQEKITHKYYTSVLVEDGDSLWSIADEYYSPEFKERDAFIQEVIQLNHISGETIHEGNYLTIPYYSSEQL